MAFVPAHAGRDDVGWDFFHVDCAVTLRRIYVLFALEVGDRYLHVRPAWSRLALAGTAAMTYRVARRGAGGIRRSFRIMRIVGALWPRCPRRLPRSWGLAALVAVAVAVFAVAVLDLLLVGHGPVPAAWRTLLVGGAVSVAVLLAGLRVLHVTEVDPRVARLRHR